MNAHISERWEPFIRAQVQSGRFASENEVLDEALNLLKRQDELEKAHDLEGIRKGLEDMRAGRTQPLAEAFADIRRELDLPPAQ